MIEPKTRFEHESIGSNRAGKQALAPATLNGQARKGVSDQKFTQNYVRGITGTIAACTYKDLIPEDEAFDHDGRLEQYYIVHFRQKDLWEEYPFDNDTLRTEFPDRWLGPVRN